MEPLIATESHNFQGSQESPCENVLVLHQSASGNARTVRNTPLNGMSQQTSVHLWHDTTSGGVSSIGKELKDIGCDALLELLIIHPSSCICSHGDWPPFAGVVTILISLSKRSLDLLCQLKHLSMVKFSCKRLMVQTPQWAKSLSCGDFVPILGSL